MAWDEIAGKIIESMSSQIDLITTLAVGICAGIVAIFLQIGLYNHSKDGQKLILNWQNLLFIAFFCEGISIISGYCAYGSITDATPIIFSLTFEQGKTFVDYEFRNAALIRWLAITQFIFFVGGIICVFICLLKNKGLLK
jgi:hypothetical protein